VCVNSEVGILVRELESDVSKAIIVIFIAHEKTLPAMGESWEWWTRRAKENNNNLSTIDNS